MGVGVSGGEEGALKGPSMMVGGSEEGWTNGVRIAEFAVSAELSVY